MGSVYHVTSDNQYWALRVLKTDSTRQTKGIRALVGDQRHPSLVRYKEVGMDASVGAFLVTDYIESQSITRDSMAGLTTQQRMTFLCDLIEAVTWLHDNELVHGNIKTSNVIVARRKNKVELSQFVDAGLAYVPNDLNRSKLLLRAYPTLAPEVIQAYHSGDAKAVDATLTAEADIYSLGIFIAEVFSGRKLFSDCRSVDEIIQEKQKNKILLSGINNPRKHLDLKAVSEIVAQMTAIDPSQRQKDLHKVIEGLRAAASVNDQIEEDEAA
jgi:serine/threonine protein kinase